ALCATSKQILNAGEGSMLRQFSKPVARHQEVVARGPFKPPVQMGDMIGELVLGFNDQLSRSRRCGRAQVGNEIADGEIRFMADGGNYRQCGTGDDASQALVVKCGKVFKRAATARDDHHVDDLRAIEVPEPGCNFAGSRFALDLRGIDQDSNTFMPSAQNVKHVLQGSTAARSDDADSAGQLRNCLFARLIEQAFSSKFFLELLKCELQCSGAERLQEFGGELKFAARVIDGDAPASDDLHPVVWAKSQQARLAAEHHHPELGVTILEREIQMAGLSRTEVGNFTFHPDVSVAALHGGTDSADQISHAPDPPRGRLLKGESELGIRGQVCSLTR